MASAAPSLTDIPDLGLLVDRLRNAGFRPDPRQFLTANEVLLRLAARGASAADLAGAAAPGAEGEAVRAALISHLSPVFCTSPEQQAAFADVVRRWLLVDRDLREGPGPDDIEKRRRLVLTKRRGARRRLMLTAVALALFAAIGATGRFLFAIHDLEIRVLGLAPEPAESTIPLPRAVVTLSDHTIQLDDSGRSLLRLRRITGDTALTVRHPGYESQDISVNVDRESPLEIILQPPPKTPDEEPDSFLRLGSPQIVTPPDLPPTPAVERHWRLAAGAGSAVGIALFLGLVWVDRRRRRSVLRRMPADGRSDLESFGFDPSPLAAIGSREMRQVVGALRRQREIDATALDVERTVEATARGGGLFMPVVSARQRMPDYVVLVERRAADDHFFRLVASFLDPLARNGVPLDCFEFSGDPSVCRRLDNPVRQLSIAELDYGAVLFVFAETDTFFDQLTGAPASWVDGLRDWQRRAFFTPTPPYLWGERERRLAETGAAVLPATVAGVRTFGETSADGNVRRRDLVSYARRYPEVLAGNSIRWLDREAPPAATIETLVAQLRGYLGPSGFSWLAACGVYPAISWPLTLDLARAVHPAASTPEQFTSSVLPALSRLPWMRHAYMPDWLRRVLLRQLPPEAEGRIRAHVDATLNRLGRRQRLPGLPEENTLDITAAEIVTTMPADSPMKDAVFVGFVSGTNTPDLAVLAPRVVVDVFRRLRRLPTPEEEKIAAPARSWLQRVSGMLLLFRLRHPQLVRAAWGMSAAVVGVGLAALMTTTTTPGAGGLQGYHALSMTGDGPSVVVAGVSGDTVTMRYLPGPMRLFSLAGTGRVTAVALREDGVTAVTAQDDVSYSVITRDSPRSTRIAGVITAMAFSSVGLVFASSRDNGSEVFIEDLGARRFVPFARSRDIVTSLCERGAKTSVLAFGVGQDVRLFRNYRDVLGESSTPRESFLRGVGRADAIAISPDLRWIAVAVEEKLSLYALSGSRLLTQVDAGGPIRAVAISPSGDQVGALTATTVAVWPVLERPPGTVTPPRPSRGAESSGAPPEGLNPNPPTKGPVVPPPTVPATQDAGRSTPPAAEPPPNAAEEKAALPERVNPSAQQRPRAESQPEPPRSEEAACSDVKNIRELGWRRGDKEEFCRQRRFDGTFKTPDADYCYRGDLFACNKRVSRTAR